MTRDRFGADVCPCRYEGQNMAIIRWQNLLCIRKLQLNEGTDTA
jgi:ferredoxin-thioredoxin reductase catalytic subunit